MITVAAPSEVVTLRIRHEYLEMPGLRLTVAQAARLFGVPIVDADDVLQDLEREGFLRRSVDGRQSAIYSRLA